MHILITGGAGFIGSHLAEYLLQKDNHVSIIDNLSTGSIANIKHLKDNPNFTYSIESIMNIPHMAEMIDEVDQIYHLAAAVGVQQIVDDPVQTITTNIKGTEIVLELANTKKKKVLLASTSEVYGKSTALPFNENGDLVMGATVKPRWSYACSKAIDEFLALAYGKAQNLPVTIVRLFNTVGPRQTGLYGMVIPRFIGQALNNEPLTVYGSGEQCRCFGHVTDVIDAMVKLMDNPKAEGQVFNVGNAEEISINALAQKIIERSNSQSEIVHIPFAEAYNADFEDMDRRIPDLTKIKTLIDYNPSRTIDNIIDDVIESMKAE